MPEAINQFRGGLGYYRKGDFPRAIAQFREALALHPGDKLSETYIQRCEYLLAHPPGGSWDGVWVMKSK
jgi:adenylate cyclase